MRRCEHAGRENEQVTHDASGDGVVPQWSVHLDRVAAESIVPYTHRCLEKPKTVHAVMKILKGAR